MKRDRLIEYWARMLGESEVGETFVVPPPGDKAAQGAFAAKADGLYGGEGAYGEFVPDDCDEMEGERRDLDDWDVYRVNHRRTIDRDRFWEQAFDRMYDDFGEGAALTGTELRNWLDAAGPKIAEEAWDEYAPSEDELVHRGRDKGYMYWH